MSLDSCASRSIGDLYSLSLNCHQVHCNRKAQEVVALPALYRGKSGIPGEPLKLQRKEDTKKDVSSDMLGFHYLSTENWEQ